MKIKVTILLWLILTLAATSLAQQAQTPFEAARAFWESLSKTNVENAKKLIDEKLTGNVDKKLQFESGAIKDRKLKLIEVSAKNVGTEFALVELKLKDKNNKENECLITLFKNLKTNQWKIIYWSFGQPLIEFKIASPKNPPDKTVKPGIVLPLTDPPVVNPSTLKNGD